MIFPAWSRLCAMYAGRITRLLSGEEPWERLVRSEEFRERADEVAEAMVRQVMVENARSWRDAAFKSGRGRKIYEALQRELRTKNLQPYLSEIARRNAELIKSLPDKVAQQITEHAQTLYQEGKRPEEIRRELKLVAPRMTRAHANLIARTEIGKAETAITVGRAESIDINWGVWETSKDQRVRDSHRNLSGVLVRFDDPPDPDRLIGKPSRLGRALPGEQPNCRCLLLPLISLDEISWPHKVFRMGSITRMTRGNFAALAGYPKAA
jgi:SPP1 gp7 family putative phage head morphogenesis protein